MKLLKIVSIENATSEKGNAYKKVGFEPYVMHVAGQPAIVMLHKTSYRNCFPASELSDGSVVKADVLHTKIESGEVKVNTLIAGSIESFKTTPYTLGNNTTERYTGVFFDGENAIALAARNLRDNNAGVIDSTTGEVIYAQAKQVTGVVKVKANAGNDDEGAAKIILQSKVPAEGELLEN